MSELFHVLSWISAGIAIVKQIKGVKQFKVAETSRAYVSELIAATWWAVAYGLLAISKAVM